MPLQLRRIDLGCSLVTALLLALMWAGSGKAATPSEGTIGPPAGTSVDWLGQYYEARTTPSDLCQDGATDSIDLNCDHFLLRIQGVVCTAATPCNVTVRIDWPSAGCTTNPTNTTGLCNPPVDPQQAEDDDWDLFIFTCPVVVPQPDPTTLDPLDTRDRCSGGEQVASSENFPGVTFEEVTFSAEAQQYEVRALPFNVTFTDYEGTATFGGGGTGGGGQNGGGGGIDPPVWISDARIVEGDSGLPQAVFTLTMGWATSVPATVNYSTEDVSATSGSDYVVAAGEAVFVPGTTVTKISVPIQPDLADEPNERFAVNLFLGTPAVVKIFDERGVATIVDDDWKRFVRTSAKTIDDAYLSMWLREGRYGKLSYRDDGLRFYTTWIRSATFDDLTRTARFEGNGRKNGQQVTFTLEAVDRGAGALDSFLITLSDGTRLTGPLASGDIEYLG